jgi:SPP1 gp7 family putative phage head morphogenesis protein
MVRAYLRAVKNALRQREFAHASPASMTLGQFLRYMELLAKREITDKSVFSEEMSARAYGQGRAFGGITLGAPPEVRERIWKKTSVLVERSKSAFVKMSDDVAGNVKRVIADGITKEWSQGEIIKEIEALSDASESSARRIVRTETMEAVNTGVMDTYRAEDIEKVEWLAAEGCCPACQALDGRVFAIDSGVSAPLHPNCRCTLLPVVDVPGKDIVEAEEWVEE